MGSGERTRAMLMNAAERTSSFLARRRDHAVCGRLPGALLQDRLDSYDFDAPRQIEAVMDDILELLAGAAVRSDHPRYFGLFNPPALPEGIVGDLLAAAVNPQLAVWSHAPAAAEVERKLLQWFGTRIGWDLEETAGMFTSGGTEANHTALIAALSRRYPGWPRSGLAGTAGRRPVVYVSSEAHLAWIKIARSVGLGSDSVRLIPTADGLRLDAETAKSFLLQEPHLDPVLFVATAGTTAHGAVDDIRGLAALARSRQAHFHVDAAWAGGAVVSDALRRLLPGIELADSVTIDPHKWLAVPMGAGMYLSRDWAALEAAFSVATGYMPSASVEHRDPYIHSLQWSRRFIGLKLFMALATLGKQGYSELVERQVILGDLLRKKLIASGWRVVNDTPLPLACFVPEAPAVDADAEVRAIESFVASSGVAWISSVALRGRLALRACITSFETTQDDIAILISQLDEARRHVRIATSS